MMRAGGRAGVYRVGVAVVVAILTVAPVAGGQVPGVPVLQNAFANPGVAFALNVGGGGGQSFFGAAGGLGLSGGRFLISGAAGVQRANQSTRGAYGARASATVWRSSGGALGVGAFAGVGGAPRTRDGNSVTTNPAVFNIPAGLTIGYRRPLGDTRGFSVYASPMYQWARTEANDVSTSSGNVAGSVGVDFAVSQSIGVTTGAEFGRSAGTTRSTYGLAVTFVPGR